MPDSQRGERLAALAALAAAGLMIAQQVGGKATRDALFLSAFRPEELPRVVIAAAAASLVTVLFASRAFARFGPARVVPLAFGAGALLHLGEWALVPVAPRGAAVALYLHAAMFGALAISGFWSVVNERFDPHTAKHVVARIGAGATLGGIAGGLCAERIGRVAEPRTMLLVLAGLGVGAALFVRRIGTPPHARRVPDPADSALELLRKTPYLRALALLVVLTAVASTLLDYALKSEAARELDRSSLLSFFALFHTFAAVLSFVLQAAITRRALSRLGVGGTVLVLPGLVALTSVAGVAVGRLWAIAVARGAELVLANSVFRSGYELLYTPVAPTTKRPTKALIDVAGGRVGDALASGGVLALLALVPALPVSWVLGLAAVAAAACFFVARSLHRGYVAQLEENLRHGSPARMEALAQQSLSTLGLEREALFEQIAAQSSWVERISQPSLDDAPGLVMAASVKAPAGDPVHGRAAALRSDDASVVRGALTASRLDPRLVPVALGLLGRRDVYPDALAALREIADEAVGPLSAALRDPAQPAVVRRRIPRVLESASSPEAVLALEAALGDERFEVRYRAALALARIQARERGGVAPSAEVVLDALGKELEREVMPLGEDDTGVIDAGERRIEHVFTLLSLAFDPEPVRLALHAIRGSDATLRGTALEYLENVLPEELRAGLWALLDARPAGHPRRSRAELTEALTAGDRVSAEPARES